MWCDDQVLKEFATGNLILGVMRRRHENVTKSESIIGVHTRLPKRSAVYSISLLQLSLGNTDIIDVCYITDYNRST